MKAEKMSYSTKLNPKILSRARIILGSLLAVTAILITAGIYQSVQSGDFDKIFIKPFKQFARETPAPTPAPTASGTTSTSKSESTVIINQNVPPVRKAQPVSTCYKMNIREGEFASNKCYLQQDYEDLQYYLGRYQSAKLNLSSAQGFEKIDCGAAQTFEVKRADCEKDKQDISAAQAEVDKYRGIIQGIIAKGQ